MTFVFPASRVMQGVIAAALALAPLAARAQAPAAPPSPPAPVFPAPAVEDLAVVGVTVIPMDRDRSLPAHTVVVRGGRIVAMGPDATTTVPAGVRRIDGRGKFLMPGLIDMHVHFLPGDGTSADNAGQHLALLVGAGVTTARGLAGNASHLALRDRVAAGDLLGPVMLVAGQSLNGNSVKSPAAAGDMVRAQHAAGVDVLKTHGGMGRAAYDTVVAAAARAGLPLSGHVMPDVGLAHALEAGQQIEHLDGYLAAAVPAGAGVEVPPGQMILEPAVLAAVDRTRLYALADRTREAGVWNGPTLALFRAVMSDKTPEQLSAHPSMRYVPRATRAAWANQKVQMLAGTSAEGRQTFLALRDSLTLALWKAGAKLLVSSDSPQFFMTPGFAVHAELQALQDAGLPPYAVLEAATRNAAEYLGTTDETGTIAVGRRGDLLLLEANPLDDVAHAERIAGVMVGGRWLPASLIAEYLDRVAAGK